VALALVHIPRVALVPNAIAFSTPRDGIAGTGWTSCENAAFRCKPQGTISLTTNGGRSWRVVLRTPRPVVSMQVYASTDYATFDDGKTLASTDEGRTWHVSALPARRPAPCPSGEFSPTGGVVVTPRGKQYALCVGGAGAGAQIKSVYGFVAGRWKRLAWASLTGSGHGGIGAFGYPLGLSMADGGFGLIWESRGTLYVTRDGGLRWSELPRIARPDEDFGQSAVALPHGIGFAVLSSGGGEKRWLIETTTAGRTWRVVHRWI